MIIKWTSFSIFFKKEWILKRARWYEGAAPNYGIEATYFKIKRERTLKKRLPVGKFLNGVLCLLEDWSKSRDPRSVNCIKFSEVRSITLDQWVTAHQWAVKNLKVLRLNHTNPDCKTFYTNSNKSNLPVTPNTVSIYQDTMGIWTSFEDFQHVYYSTWKIIINSKCLEASKCNCPYFSKYLICKHVLGIQIRLNLVKPPEEALFLSIEQIRSIKN